MTAKPTEIKRLVEVLNADYDSAEDAAKAAFDAVEHSLAGRYIVNVVHSDGTTHVVQAYGLYSTRAQAEKAISSGKIISPGGSIVSKATIAPLLMI
jgi:uncharacterized protein YegP (UPF0339 family)